MPNLSQYPQLMPSITPENKPFWDGCTTGELRLQRCDDCGELWFPASSRCPRCLSTHSDWLCVSGRATLWSWIVMHQKYFPAFEQDLPYVVALVKLDEGPLMMSTVVGASASELRCDTPLRVVFEKVAEDRSIPKFRLAD